MKRGIGFGEYRCGNGVVEPCGASHLNALSVQVSALPHGGRKHLAPAGVCYAGCDGLAFMHQRNGYAVLRVAAHKIHATVNWVHDPDGLVTAGIATALFAQKTVRWKLQGNALLQYRFDVRIQRAGEVPRRFMQRLNGCTRTVANQRRGLSCQLDSEVDIAHAP
jgi:hypothetical protein